MKKKILVGLLTVSACFALGSTSFAATAPTKAPDLSSVATVSKATAQDVNAKASFEQIIVHMNSGYWKYLPGTLELIFNDGAIVLYEDGWVQAVQYGASTIFSYDEFGNITAYTILVDRN
ncbi:hypothetical protein [Paenibacillus piscarius]|uniref:hypothetical protein n=1 Tax=Paenibacillus piscarius TaxID=1089681 RepID=UPI001EE961BE|nr:hypothetical protein [Paenibacillus piscarius]